MSPISNPLDDILTRNKVERDRLVEALRDRVNEHDADWQSATQHPRVAKCPCRLCARDRALIGEEK